MTPPDEINNSNESVRPLDKFINWAYAHPIWLLGTLLLIGVFPLILDWLLWLFSFHDKWSHLPPNEIGDTFGFLNAITSSLAFIGVLATLYMQREELSLQRQEMSDSRKELQRSAEAQTQSEKRLAAAAALNALESLRASAKSKSESKDTELSVNSEFAAVKTEILISSILSTLDVVSMDSIKSPEVKAVEELHVAIMPIIKRDPQGSQAKFYLTMGKEIKKLIMKHEDKKFSKMQSFIADKSEFYHHLNTLEEKLTDSGNKLSPKDPYVADSTAPIEFTTDIMKAVSDSAKSLLEFAILNLATDVRYFTTPPISSQEKNSSSS